MLKPVQKINLRTFVKRAAFITLILASLEVLVFLFLLREKKDSVTPDHKAIVSKDQTLPRGQQGDNQKIQDTPQTIKPPIIKPATGNQYNVDTTSIVAKTYESDSNLTKLTAENLKTEKSNPALLPIHLSNAKMLQVIKNIGAEKKRTHNNINCVQVRKTSNSNVTNAFRIAELLKARGYIISGRMVVPGTQKGIKISTRSGCIQLTIGNL